MAEVKEYISNITIPDGTTKYVKDAELTDSVNALSIKVTTNETNISDLVSKTDATNANLNSEITNRTNAISELQTSLNTTNTNVSNNAEQIKTNQSNILTNTNKIGENSADLKTAKSDIATAKSDISTLKTNVDEMIDKIYPVGSIYLAMNSTNPSTLFGGTWERIKDRFLLACGDSYTSIGTYGGEETHTLTIDEMPAHTHKYNAFDYTVTPASGTITTGHAGADQTETTSVGGGKAHNNMPPYVTCYMWQRTA